MSAGPLKASATATLSLCAGQTSLSVGPQASERLLAPRELRCAILPESLEPDVGREAGPFHPPRLPRRNAATSYSDGRDVPLNSQG